MKFHEVIVNGFKVIEWTREHDFVTEIDTYQAHRGRTQNYISKSYGSCTMHVIQFWLIFL